MKKNEGCLRRISTGIARLDPILKMAYDSGKVGIFLLDCFMGRCIRTEYSHAITTRTATDDNTFVLEIYEADTDKHR